MSVRGRIGMWMWVRILLLSALFLSPFAHGAWQPLATPGLATLGLGERPGEMALASGARVLAVSVDELVTIVNPDTGTVEGTITLPGKAGSLALDPAGTRLYVLRENASSLLVYNVATRALAGTWAVGGSPSAVALRPDGSELLVLDEKDRRIVALNPATGAQLRQKTLTIKPQKLYIDSTGTRLLIGSSDGTLLTLDATSWNTVSSVALGDTIRSISFWESAGLAIVVGKKRDSVSLVNVETGSVVASVDLDTDPDRGAVNGTSSKAYVTTKDDLSVNQIDLATRRSDGRYVLPTEASAIVFDPVTRVLYITQPKDKALLKLDPAQNLLLGTLTLNKRLRDIAVNNATHEAAAVAEKVDELTRIKLSDRSLATLVLPRKPTRIAIDSGRNLAVIALKDEVRFANLALATATLHPERVELGEDIESMAVDSQGGVTLAVTKGDQPLHLIDNATRTRIASVASTEKFTALAVDSQRGLAYLLTESKKLLTLNIATRAFTNTTTLAFRSDGIAVDAALNLAVLLDNSADEGHVVNLETRAIVRTVSLPRHPGAIDIQPDTHLAVIASKESDQVSLLNLSTFAVTAGYAAIDSPFALSISVRFNQALVLSGEKDEVTIVPLPNAVPELVSLAPAFAIAGSAAFNLSVTGKHFVDTSRVIFGTTELVTRWLNPGKLEADVTAAMVGAAGSVNVLVRTPAPGGGDSSIVAFPIALSGPVLAAISPASVPADGVAHSFNLSGQNFAPGAAVLFGGVSLVPSAIIATNLTVEAPASLFQAPATLDVKVRNADGQETGALQVTVNARPTLTAVTPSSVTIDAQPRLFTLAGSGILSGAVVMANGSTVLTPASVTATQVTVTVPGTMLATGGVLTLAVRNADGGLSNSLAITLIEPTRPFLYSLQPSSVMAGSPETLLQVSGASFVAGAVVRTGGATPVTLSANVVNSQLLRVSLPANLLTAAGELSLVVVNPGAIAESSRTSNVATLLIEAPVELRIDGIVPATGQAGDTVIIYGQGFSSVASANSVTFAGSGSSRITATLDSATGTQLAVKAPAGVVTGAVQVTVNGTTKTGPVFTVAPPNEQEYALLAGPSRVVVVAGGRTSFEVQLGANAASFTGLVKLTVTGLPAGVTGKFQPGFVSAGQVSVLELTAAANAPAAVGNFAIQGANQSTIAPNSQNASGSVEVKVAQTGVAGRFVDPRGKGIAGVRVRHDDRQTVTDTAGNFMLLELAPGDLSLRMDATPASPLYPIWPVNVKVEAGKVTNLRDWTINPPPEATNFVTINNATQAQQITDPRYPGLAITLPAGVDIVGWDGVKKTRIAIERLDPDKLPVDAPPLPNRSSYQLYFGTPMGGIPTAPIPFTLPNDLGLEPGQKAELLYFDGSPMGGEGMWKSAGTGTVSDDGLTIVTDPGMGVPRFCGVCGLVSFCNPNPDPPDCPSCGGGGGPSGPSGSGGKPVTLVTGQEQLSAMDLALAGRWPVRLGRTFNPHDPYNNIGGTTASFGLGWVNEYDVAFLPFQGPQKRLVMPGQGKINFQDDGAGVYRNKVDGRFTGARIVQAEAQVWEMRFADGVLWRFRPYPGITGALRGGPPFFLAEIKNSAGESLFLTRTPNGRLTAIGTPERQLTIALNGDGFIDTVTDPLGRQVKYSYNENKRISVVTHTDGRAERYTYADDSEFPIPQVCKASGGGTTLEPKVPAAGGGVRLKTIQLPGENPTVNHYGPSWRVLRQTAPDGSELRFKYRVTGACVVHQSNPSERCKQNCPVVDSSEAWEAGWYVLGGEVVETIMENAQGNTTSQRFAPDKFPVAQTDAHGRTTVFERDPNTRRITRMVDFAGRVSRYTYDPEGRINRAVDPMDRMVEYSYDPTWKSVQSITRWLTDGTPLTTTQLYDPLNGNLVTLVNPEGHATTLSYTRGQVRSVIDPLQNSMTNTFNDAGDIVKITNALNEESLVEVDAVGQVVKTTDPLGFTASTTWDALGRVTERTDALTGSMKTAYDAQGNVASVADQKGNIVERRLYDARNRLLTRIDALNAEEHFTYNSLGQLTSFTDRKGKITSYTHDEMGRLIRTIFPDGVTQNVRFDAWGRVAAISESGGPRELATSYEYDKADRMTRTRVSTGQVTYELAHERDAVNLLKKRTLTHAGTSHVTDYKHDRNGRLLEVAYGGQKTTFTYDRAGHLVQKKLPNGITEKRENDALGRPMRVTFENAAGQVVSELAYQYDHRSKISSRTRTPAYPEAAESEIVSQYDSSSRLTATSVKSAAGESRDEFVFEYDLNGNITSRRGVGSSASKTVQYTWDARNRLVALHAEGLVASFGYDEQGRRISRVVNGVTTHYMYDEDQAIAELIDGALDVLITGAGVDETLARYGAENKAFVTDLLSSTLEGTSGQDLVTSYAYSPYGRASQSGESSRNSNQYTGRENDGTGLYFHRARYYDPMIGRFISQDPIGLSGGINLYAYPADPISHSDPSGKAAAVAGLFCGPPCWIATGVAITGIILYEICTKYKPKDDPCQEGYERCVDSGMNRNRPGGMTICGQCKDYCRGNDNVWPVRIPSSGGGPVNTWVYCDR